MFLQGPKVLAIGDSITYDTTATLNGAWRFYFGEPFSQWFGAPIRWVGDNPAISLSSWAGTKMCGASGQRVDEILSSYDPGGQVARLQPDIVVIYLMMNNATQLNSGTWVGGSEAQTITDYQTLLTTIFANGHSNMLVCCVKINPNGTAGVDTIITSLNSAMGTMVSAHPNANRIFTSDVNTAFKNNVNWLADYMSDNTHPNDAGSAVIASTIQSSIEANITLMPRTTADRHVGIKPHTASLQYRNGNATTLNAGTTVLDTTMSWSVAWRLDMQSGKFTTVANGVWSFKTDQATPFFCLLLRGTNLRGIEFGSNANFNRFFPSVANTWATFTEGWHSFVITYNGSGRTTVANYKLYIDGQNVAVTNGSGLQATNSNEIGGTVSGSTSKGVFDMAELLVWNGANSDLTAQQVANWHYNHILPSGPILTHNWDHKDASGGTLSDVVGGLNGTIGAATWTTSNLATAPRTTSSARTQASSRTVAT